MATLSTTSMGKPVFDTTAHFEKVASTYEDTSHGMKEVASHLLVLSPPLTSASVILDNAAGPGIVTGEILQLPQFTNPSSTSSYPEIHATDYSPAMIRALEARAIREHWPPNVVRARPMDSMDLSGFAADTFTHIYMSAAIFIVPDAVKAAAEMWRTLRRGGTALVTSFEKQGFVQIFQEAQRAVRPQAPLWHGPIAKEWMTEGKLRAVMVEGGFEDAKVVIERYVAELQGDAWSKPAAMELMMMFSKMITNGWTEEEKSRFEEKLKSDMASEAVRGKKYEMKIFIAVATK